MKTVTAESRVNTASRSAKRVRREGKVPGVLYGRGWESQPLQFRSGELLQAIRQNGLNRPFRLKWNDKEVPVMIAELQRRPLDDTLLHVDVVAVELQEEMEAAVPLTVTGKPASGQYLLHAHEIVVRCLPTEIPQTLPLSLDGLEVGDAVKASDLQLPPGVTVVHDEDAPLATIEPKRELMADGAASEQEEPAAPEES